MSRWVISFLFAPCYVICWNNRSHLKLIVVSAFFQNNDCISCYWSTTLSSRFPFFFSHISEFENVPRSILLLNYSVSPSTHEFPSTSLCSPTNAFIIILNLHVISSAEAYWYCKQSFLIDYTHIHMENFMLVYSANLFYNH